MTTSGPRRPSFDSRRPAVRLASDKAAAFWASLRADLTDLLVEAARLGVEHPAYVPPVRATLPADECSEEIDAMLDALRELRSLIPTARRTARRQATTDDAAALVPDRLYERDGEIYRTVLSGAGNLYAKIWDGEGWAYAAGAIRDLRPEHRMTRERAIELSCRIGHCIRCGTLLTAKQSVERGIGPICITKI